MLDETVDSNHRKILVAGNYLLRRGIAGIVNDLATGASIVEVSCFFDAAARLRTDEFFAAIFDIDGPDTDGPSDFRMLRADHPWVILTVFSRTEDAGIILSYLAAGVNGYILGSSSQSEIERAIRTLLGRATYVPPSMTNPGIRRQDRGRALPLLRREAGGLTSRQSAVLELLLNEYSNKEIARKLDLSPHTVKIHVSALLRHFSVRRRMDLAIVASRESDEGLHRYHPLTSQALEIQRAPQTGRAALHMY